jgi:hypothetical protein
MLSLEPRRNAQLLPEQNLGVYKKKKRRGGAIRIMHTNCALIKRVQTG